MREAATESGHYILSPLSLSEALIRLKKVVLFTSSTNCTQKVWLAAKTSIYFPKRKAHSNGFPRDMFSGTKVCDHQLLSKLLVPACLQVNIAFGTTCTPIKGKPSLNSNVNRSWEAHLHLLLWLRANMQASRAPPTMPRCLACPGVRCFSFSVKGFCLGGQQSKLLGLGAGGKD